MKLLGYSKLTAILHLKSGLHIGSGEKGHFGEPLAVIKSPLSQLPYIPGSSIKGKLRSLLEIAFDRVKNDGRPCDCGRCQVCLLFGSSESRTTFEPSRLIFRDCYLTEQSRDLLENIELEKKAGVRIDRKTGKAAEKALYATERVPEGSEFRMEISIRHFDGDNNQAMRDWLSMGLFLMEQDALGGGGTRGSGHFEFKTIRFDDIEFDADWREKIKDKKNILSKTLIRTE